MMKLKKRKIKYSAFSLIGILAKISTCLAENDIAERISYVSFCKKENVDGQCSAILSV